MPELLLTLASPAENGASLHGASLVCPAENGDTIYSFGGTYTAPPAPPGGIVPAPSTAATFVIGAQSTYPIIHTLSVIDLRDGTELPFDSVSLSNDVDSIFWTFSGSGKSALFSRLQAGIQPASLRVALDGQVWEFVVEAVSRSRAMPESDVRVSGRSVTCAAGAPYEFEQNWTIDGDTTAAQIAASANLNTGLNVVWGITDWPVPDRVLSHFGTPLSVVKRVAEAVGAIVQSERTGYSVKVLPRYPLLPNEWSVVAPDVEIALAAVISESFERDDRPDYDGVYAMGQQKGAFAFVRLAGTSGAQLAPLVTDLLLTDDDACAQRGAAILGASGQQQLHSLLVPVLTGTGQPGVLDVNMLVRVVEPALTWYGMVRGVTVAVALPEVRQQLRVERHTRAVGGTTSTPPATVTPLLFTGPIANLTPATGAAVSLPLAPFWSLGVPPYVWSMRSGTLPSWLTLNQATGLVSGTAPGSAVPATPLAFRATDAINSTADSNVFNLSVVSAGITWTSRGSIGNWVSPTISADGLTIVALNSAAINAIFTSADGGLTWAQRISAPSDFGIWATAAASDDGTKIVALSAGGPGLGSGHTSNNSGVTWTRQSALNGVPWSDVASSADGVKLVACASSDFIYTSINSGITWAQREARRAWKSVASSADGVKLVACVLPGFIYTSIDSGVTWTQREASRSWQSVGSSADGVKLVACVSTGFIYTSIDSGLTWTQREASRSWQSVGSSADGVKLVASANSFLYTSADSGVTWIIGGPIGPWGDAGVTRDGTKFVAAVVSDGFIHTGV